MANILKTEKKAQAVSLLCDGSSIRSIERITGIHRNTIMRLGVRMGDACAKIQDEKFRNLNCSEIQVDEIGGFIGAKKKNASMCGAYGDVWTFIGLDRDSKLIPAQTTNGSGLWPYWKSRQWIQIKSPFKFKS